MNHLILREFDQMLGNVVSDREMVVDARAPARFNAEEPEPRPGLKGGHIPGSVNLHYARLVDPETHTLLPPDELRERFEEAGVDVTRPVTATCGSGVTAPIVAFALYVLGNDEAAVYDGSWSEWGARENAPVEP